MLARLGAGMDRAVIDADWQRLAQAWDQAAQAIREVEGVVTTIVAPLAKES
jgi:hypothetical protein